MAPSHHESAKAMLAYGFAPNGLDRRGVAVLSPDQPQKPILRTDRSSGGIGVPTMCEPLPIRFG
ncbi:hypothetical protein [Belnapia sp. F-4-1]|uniref:hypothetical protein n=1 Tax=Belnapia sp. F-4-1 TaxID=1545443 RepID=UPI0011852D11|nr:hypothetical protein [Belnapia sp. F-4-1]